MGLASCTICGFSYGYRIEKFSLSALKGNPIVRCDGPEIVRRQTRMEELQDRYRRLRTDTNFTAVDEERNAVSTSARAIEFRPNSCWEQQSDAVAALKLLFLNMKSHSVDTICNDCGILYTRNPFTPRRQQHILLVGSATLSHCPIQSRFSSHRDRSMYHVVVRFLVRCHHLSVQIPSVPS